MTVVAVKTKAEQQLLAQFDEAAARLPNAAARRDAIGIFAAKGLPNRRVEAWKYTDLRALVKEAYIPSLAPIGGDSAVINALDSALDSALGPQLARLDGARYVFIDGAFDPKAGGPLAGLGQTHHFVDAAGVWGKPGWEWMQQPGANAAQTDGDVLLALNTAFASDGTVLRVSPGHDAARPIHLIFVATSAAPSAVSTTNFIRIEAGVTATILESHVGLAGTARQSNCVMRFHVCAGATLHHIKLADAGPGATQLDTTIVHLDAGATCNAMQFSQSPALARFQHYATFLGEGGSYNFNAAFLGRDTSHTDTTMVIEHAVPRCTSREVVKGVLDDSARGVFQGKVIVRPDAQKSDGKQMAKALLLSSDAEFDSKPELEIYADDVVCGHGSTVSELDEQQVFYLCARGIPEAQARALLTEAFVAEPIEAIKDDQIREALRARLQGWLQGAKQ